MQPVQERMLKIVRSLPKNFFENKSPSELVKDLGKKYIEIYGYDETTKIPDFENKNLKTKISKKQEKI